jgi:3-methyladenine DNA glycosylase AlkC
MEGIMAELFKDKLSLKEISRLERCIAEQSAQFGINFDNTIFYKKLMLNCSEMIGQSNVVDESEWQLLSLMQRLRAAAQALNSVIPQPEGAKVVLSALQNNDQLSGWLSLVCCEYIATHELLTLEEGLQSLQKMTEYFSAEFAIRHFLVKQPETTLAVLTNWLTHENHHVRRLISEGTRPRLPWGVRLPMFIEQPELVMPLLYALRDDDEEYVRRSVANHLNDIAKDHPQLVIITAQQWMSAEELKRLNPVQRKQRIKLIRHACRTLFKKGQPEVMALFGYQPATDVSCQLTSKQLQVPFYGSFEFEMALEKETDNDNLLMVDYVVHFQKANGKQAPKVFKWLDRSFTHKDQQTISRMHSFKKISTRKYYPGTHRLEVMVNGIKKAQIEFELLAEVL